MMTIAEDHFYRDVATIKRTLQEQNEILRELVETLNKLNNEKK